MVPHLPLLAHTPSETGHEDPVQAHLSHVSELAGAFAEAFDARAEAAFAGVLHDLGKYGELFQRRLRRQAKGVDHWSLGAWAALVSGHDNGIASALTIEGHHIGLQEATRDHLGQLEPTRLQANHPLGLTLAAPSPDEPLAQLQSNGLPLPAPPESTLYAGLHAERAAAMLDLRMLYSCLVDADFLATEAHFRAPGPDQLYERPVGPALDAGGLLDALMSHLERIAQESDAAGHVVALRQDLLRVCLEAAPSPRGLYTLTAPTGAGKTLSMLAFALAHAQEHGQRRIVVVLPYLTLIEQTAKEYAKALSQVIAPDRFASHVLEHHSLATHRGDDQELEGEARLLAENWDAPIIITTSVQFFESIFSNRPAACRKLHRLAGSVVLCDEVQSLPARLAVPTLATLSRLTEAYRATVVFSTATQPAFASLHDTVKTQCALGWSPREIVPPSLDLFARARRTTVSWPVDGQRLSWDQVADLIGEQDQVLCIVNLKRHAGALLDALEALGVDSLAHLSTNMCPAHRQVALGDVRHRLHEGEPCRLVSTQCVEAGVHLDFPLVLRAMAPLDAVAQAAGRCNREGRLNTGKVRVFVPDDERGLYPDRTYQQAAAVTQSMLADRGDIDINDPAAFECYYDRLYDIGDIQHANQELRKALDCQDFPCVAQLYRLIRQDAINVVVPYDAEAFAVLDQEAKDRGLSARWISRARPYTVGVYRPGRPDHPLASLLEPVRVGQGREDSQQWFIYRGDAKHYDPMRGLQAPEAMSCLIA